MASELEEYAVEVRLSRAEGAASSRAAADTVAALCTAVHHVELARAREVATELEALGMHLPSMEVGTSETTAPCAMCGDAATKLFHITRGTKCGDVLMDIIDKRIGTRRVKRVDGKQKKDAIRTRVKEVNNERGEYVCFGCAAPRIMEARRQRAGEMASQETRRRGSPQ